MRIIAVIPAHNEEESVADTVRSLLAQTMRPDAVYVVADNCTDRTAEVARNAGARVILTMGNIAKKAGALNQALRLVTETLDADDLILAMDADSTLDPQWISNGVRHLQSGAADAVGAACLVVKRKGVVPLVQRVEYVMQRRRIERRRGKVEVLSGAGLLIPVGLLRRVAGTRGRILPGQSGDFYDSFNLTEDYELTVALKKLGYKVRSFRDMIVTTDAMMTVRDLTRQRVRWQRGTLETLWTYRATAVGLRGWATQAMIYSFSLVTPLLVLLWAMTLLNPHGSLHVRWVWLAVVPIFLADQLQQAWRSGAKGRVLAASIAPLWIYDTFRNGVYWYALGRSLLKTDNRWH